eukprot:7187632-Pyramimonas_sp.AAC.1
MEALTAGTVGRFHPSFGSGTPHGECSPRCRGAAPRPRASADESHVDASARDRRSSVWGRLLHDDARVGAQAPRLQDVWRPWVGLDGPIGRRKRGGGYIQRPRVGLDVAAPLYCGLQGGVRSVAPSGTRCYSPALLGGYVTRGGARNFSARFSGGMVLASCLATRWTLRAVMWTLRATRWMPRATRWMLRATMWTLRANEDYGHVFRDNGRRSGQSACGLGAVNPRCGVTALSSATACAVSSVPLRYYSDTTVVTVDDERVAPCMMGAYRWALVMQSNDPNAQTLVTSEPSITRIMMIDNDNRVTNKKESWPSPFR